MRQTSNWIDIRARLNYLFNTKRYLLRMRKWQGNSRFTGRRWRRRCRRFPRRVLSTFDCSLGACVSYVLSIRTDTEAALQDRSGELLEQQAVASDDVGCSDYRRMILDKLAESNRELEVPIQTERQIERERMGGETE